MNTESTEQTKQTAPAADKAASKTGAKSPAKGKATVAAKEVKPAVTKEVKPETKPEGTTTGQATGEAVQAPAVTAPADKTNKPSKRDEFMAHYKKAYPKERAFHVTSDNQVFLSADLQLAKKHQKTVDEKQDVETIQVK